MFRIQNIRYVLLLFLLVLTALSYNPSFSNLSTEGGSNPLSRLIVIMTVLTFLLYFNYHQWFRNRFVKTYIFWTILIGIVGYVLALTNISNQYKEIANTIIMAFVFLAIGYNTRANQKQLAVLIILYSLSVAYVSYNQLIQHAGGFVILDLYLSYGKNTLGVMCAVSCISLLLLLYNQKNKYYKVLLFALYLFILVLCISIRARAAFLTIFVLSTYILYKILKYRKITMSSLSWIIFGGLIVVVLLLLFPQVYTNISDYIYDSFFQNHEDDITTGRIDRLKYGIDIVGQSPLFGNLVLHRRFDSLIIHNFFIRQLTLFGIIGSLPILILYLYIFVHILKRMFTYQVGLSSVGYFVFIVVLIISLEEPTFPFAPGTGVIMPFILLGYSQYRSDEVINH